MKIHIGCGNNKRKGFYGIDIKQYGNVDLVANLNKKLPLDDSVTDHIIMPCILEHLKNWDRVMQEMHRISKHKGIIEIWIPHFSNMQTWADLQHYRGGSYFMFHEPKQEKYWQRSRFNILERRILIEGREYPFEKVKTRWHYPFKILEHIANKYPYAFERLWCYWIGGAEGLYFKLEVV